MPTERTIPLPADPADPVQRAVQARAFCSLLASGRPVPVEGLSRSEQHAVADLRQRGRLTLTAHGAIDGSLGLTIRPTRHRLELAEGVRYTWCALDAVAIMATLERTGTVVSRPPDSRDSVQVAFAAGEVAQAPDGAALLVPGAATGPVVQTWCPLANLFTGAEQAHVFARRRGLTDYTVLDLGEAIAEGVPLWTAALRDTT
ncbi:organomercurial lyase [Nonomuraea typhae]|uniref:Organomercurial lyase n=1 Tax=Nonomuraea typhae TaxID=2603600 RepID=A0ABW7Z716_9ACTN